MKIDLPLLKQEAPHTCLPACLRIVMRYLDEDLSEGDIAGACRTTLAGTTVANAAHGAHALGFGATTVSASTLDDLLHYLDRNEPPVVLLGLEHLPYGDHGTHAVVVCGLDGNQVTYVDPASGREMQLSAMAFLRSWRSRQAIGLVLYRTHPGTDRTLES